MPVSQWIDRLELANRMFGPEERIKFPHMRPNEREIWVRFLDKFGHEFVGFRYDVHVGGDVERVSSWTEKEFNMASWLVCKRIDAVGYKVGSIWIIEVKPEGGVTAVGQLMTYRMLFIEKYSPVNDVRCLLVCANVLPDEVRVLNAQGFGVQVV